VELRAAVVSPPGQGRDAMRLGAVEVVLLLLLVVVFIVVVRAFVRGRSG
jgi:hypothetical protein